MGGVGRSGLVRYLHTHTGWWYSFKPGWNKTHAETFARGHFCTGNIGQKETFTQSNFFFFYLAVLAHRRFSALPLPLKHKKDIFWEVGVQVHHLQNNNCEVKFWVKIRVISGVTTPIKQFLENKFCVTNHVSQFPCKDLCKLMYVMYVRGVGEHDVNENDDNVDHKHNVDEIDIDDVVDQKQRKYKRRSQNVRVHFNCAHSEKTVVAPFLSRSCQSCMVHSWKAVIYENVERFFAGFLWEHVVRIRMKSCHRSLHDSPRKITCKRSLAEIFAGSMSQTCLCEHSWGHLKIPSSRGSFFWRSCELLLGGLAWRSWSNSGAHASVKILWRSSWNLPEKVLALRSWRSSTLAMVWRLFWKCSNPVLVPRSCEFCPRYYIILYLPKICLCRPT